jgi:hypothetical protein
MANNIVQVKRTSVAGRTPNTTSSGNSQYIAAGELALNMPDGILYTSNGSALIEVGANNTQQNISTNNLTVGNTLFVVANGNVGIGNSAPASKLHVNGSIVIGSTTGSTPNDRLVAAYSSANYIDLNKALVVFSSGATAWGFRYITASGFHEYGDSATGVNATNAPRLYPEGPYTIGWRNGTNPQIHRIYGTFTDGSNYERLNLSANSTAAYVLSQQAGTGTARPLNLGANNTTHMVIATNGNVGIGTDGTGGTHGFIFDPANKTLTLGTTNAPGGTYLISGASTGGSSPVNLTIKPGDYTSTAAQSSANLNLIGGSRTNASDTNFKGGKVVIQGGGATLGFGEVVLQANGGNVGIGNTTPASKFVIQDSVTANAATSFELNPTWTGGTANTFTAFRINATDTSSNSNSLLFDVAQNSSSVFYVKKYTGTQGEIGINSNGGIWNLRVAGNEVNLIGSASNHNVKLPGANFLRAGVGYGLELGSSSNGAVLFSSGQEATNTIGQRNGTNAQTYRLYGTYTDASNYERLNLSVNSTAAYVLSQQAGTGTARPLNLGANNATAVTISTAGNVGVGTASPAYKLEVNGSFAATTKSFVIKHPTKKGKKLRYGSLEGPENGVYVRGRITDSNTIELPDYWHKLVDKDSITVSLTPIGKTQQPSVNKVTAKKITLIGENIDCFYHVFAERKDVEKLIVEIDE